MFQSLPEYLSFTKLVQFRRRMNAKLSFEPIKVSDKISQGSAAILWRYRNDFVVQE